LPKTVTRQRRDCDLNPGPSAPESSTLTTRLPSHPLASIASAFSSRSIALLSLFPLRCSRTVKHELDLIILKQRKKIHTTCTGVDKGAQGAQAPTPMAGQKNFLVKIEGLSSLPPGHACYDSPTGRGYFYQMPNMYTCIAFQLKFIKHKLDLIILKFLSWRRFSTVVLLAVCGDGVRKRSHVLRAARRCAAPVK